MFDRDFHPRWTIARRDVSALTREKTIVLAILIQLFIAAFSSFLVVGLSSLYDPSSVEGGEIELAVTGEQKQALERAAAGTEGVEVISYESQEAARNIFQDPDQEIAAVVSATTLETDSGSKIGIEATVPAESIQTTVIVVKLRDLLTELERKERAERIEYLDYSPREMPPKDQDRSSPYFSFRYTILLPLLLFLPPFISGSIAVDSLTEEIERGTLELLRVSPVDLIDIVDGKAAGMILIAPLQSGAWILLLQANSIPISHVIPILIFVTAIATLTVVLGIVLGLLTGRRRQAQLLYSILALLLFGSTVVLPEHPASTVALLAADSATTVTFATVAGFAGLAVVLYGVTRRHVGRIDPESL